MLILSGLQFYHWIIIIVGFLLVSGLIFSIVLTFAIAKRVYWHTLSRKYNGWGRTCSAPEIPEQLAMWNAGLEWEKVFDDKKEELSIISDDGLKLQAQFFNFGSKKTVIFLCGRCECLCYAYYYAKPYQEMGINCMFIDQRGHGLSEGEYSTVGILESKDTGKWMHYLIDNRGQEKFYLHCVCIGGATGTLMASKPENAPYVEKIIIDGAFINFKETYKRHYKALGHKTFPVYYEIWHYFKKYTGVSVEESSPYDALQKIECPVLFIHGRHDVYSTPENAEKLLAVTQSKDKKIVWFDEGTHSHIRDHNVEKYDETVKNFIKE